MSKPRTQGAPHRKGMVCYSIAWWPDGRVRYALYRPIKPDPAAPQPEPVAKRRERTVARGALAELPKQGELL